MITVNIDQSRSNRIIVPDTELDESISRNFGLAIGNYPMIGPPKKLRSKNTK